MAETTVLLVSNSLWSAWYTKTNQLLTALGSTVVTANGAAAGAVTTGNGYVTGIFGATTLTANTVRGGTVDVPAALTLGSNLSVNASFSIIHGNLTINSTFLAIGNSTASLTSNSTVLALSNSTATSTLNPIGYTVGGVTVNTSLIAVGANSFMNATAIAVSTFLSVGNSTVNTQINSTAITAPAISFTTITVGSNVSINSSTISVGNSTVNTQINSTMTKIGANVVANGSVLLIGNSSVNVSINSSAVVVGGVALGSGITLINVSTSGTGSQVVDSFDRTVYRAGHYILSYTDNISNNYMYSDVGVLHSGGVGYVTTYAVINSNTQLGLFTASTNATHFILNFTPTTTAGTLKGNRFTTLA